MAGRGAAAVSGTNERRRLDAGGIMFLSFFSLIPRRDQSCLHGMVRFSCSEDLLCLAEQIIQ